MKKPNYSDVLCKAEAIAKNPKNLRKDGQFKTPIKRRLNSLTNRIVFLSQFEVIPNN